MARRPISNPLALAVLSCLYERPMYPYEITTTLRERGKDDSIRLNFGSLYSVIKSLQKHGLITEARAEREGNRPERVVYEITQQGRSEAISWLREILAVPTREYPDVEAGLSLVPMLSPDEVAALLRSRVAALDADLDTRRAALAETAAIGLPEVFTIESDYRVAMIQAERDWVHALVERLGRGDVEGQDGWREMHRLRTSGATAEEIGTAIANVLPEALRPRSGAGGGDPTA
ncbi:transcriptional regulator, PadR-like family [Beutenbergia cavernae DSM 12333]|uniref:Transcriptional regulator, PadR-like family n=1 Tax=Beutenbergia cavernae (strain ATCC BAA-8 / DSM 12333 / CCUG 43141 / JCM 11478 / NBRC 16432 / NCIMB 13614 / HKI 0122) TaxID=471853 RepID=C5C2U7_BEUC1|nr:PadR family transcriptional regulator [Beutenbergia cavernae]ACQ81791.1 transcriptional regulator, PadR-like family [Beutenbergia cavernae DSM 12333]